MSIWKTLSGMVILEITGAEPEKAIDRIIGQKIPIYKVEPISLLTYRLTVPRKDFAFIYSLTEKNGDKLKLIRKTGFYWTLKKSLSRSVLWTVFGIMLLSSAVIPTRILFVSVEGNETVPDHIILSAAENCGIRFSASRKEVRSEKVKNALLSALPQLQWAGVNTSGCTAVITVQERKEESNDPKPHLITNLVADRDGHILSATVTGGTGHVRPGDTVKAGEILISGYTDSGFCIRTARAEGEIYAQTNREMKFVMPSCISCQKQIRQPAYSVSLILGKKRINLWKDSRISTMGCGRMYKEYYVSLPGGFQLPIALCIDKYSFYEIQKIQDSETDEHIWLQKFAEDYLIRQMIAGQIVHKQERFSFEDGMYILESRYICAEVIGKEQREQIGVFNGKRN